MGVFTVSCEVQAMIPGSRAISVGGLLVDSGSELTWLPASVLAEAGVTVAKRDEQFCLANGQTITRSIGYALLRAEGFETVDEVVFGQPGDLPLLGARTLEGFGAVVDARRKRLVAAGAHVVASVAA
jgi:predicted aspartyl protease